MSKENYYSYKYRYEILITLFLSSLSLIPYMITPQGWAALIGIKSSRYIDVAVYTLLFMLWIHKSIDCHKDNFRYYTLLNIWSLSTSIALAQFLGKVPLKIEAVHYHGSYIGKFYLYQVTFHQAVAVIVALCCGYSIGFFFGNREEVNNQNEGAKNGKL